MVSDVGRPHCYNRAPYTTTLSVQDGYVVEHIQGNVVQLPKLVAIPWAFTDECKASSSGEAARLKMNCKGCKWESL